ncbi:MAG: L-lactate dehydrogenase [Eubacterium sp.]|nr:L-lactate dehydrogenase [Eubacterium sp.]
MSFMNTRKVGIVGCGFVGSSSAFALMQGGLFSEIVLVDVDRQKAEGEAMDISHGVSFVGSTQVTAGDYSDLADAAIIVVTAGAAQKPGETRLDLVQKNAKIMTSVIEQINAIDYKGILLIVSNPVDILTAVAQKVSTLPEKRIIGSGTSLDTARLKHKLGEHLSVDSRDVHAYIIGEHGDSEIAAWSSANVSGVPLSTMCEMRGHFDHVNNTEAIAEQVKNSAYEIIEKKHATYYGIAMVVKRLCQAIVLDEKSIFPVSIAMKGEYGIEGVVLSMPAILGEDGVECSMPISLDEKEVAKLHESADTLRETMESIE